ncbi:hypothetical protein H4R35_007279 [Dimargaris xerosporica]|nr:hypothetical protein H4R35_007279 [Dimargaris xerosporica]
MQQVPKASRASSLPRKAQFPGVTNSYFTNQLVITTQMDPIATYQVMDTDGVVDDAAQEPAVDQELAVRIYREMITMNAMDKVLYEAQRQGRISFYMTSYGEEALIGSAAALHPTDVIFGQYREAGALLHRGFSLEAFMNQCYGNALDLGKGRQMPVHYGTRDLHFVTISSTLATQIPQASGAAYALKLQGAANSNDAEPKRCVMCYFGDGAASEGDFHGALNMAATMECPVIFFCRNNGFAISTPASEQYKGDGVASRGIGYGIDTIRCDGNDVWAVYNATKKARELAVGHNRPVLIESLTYRIGHHSTSDDSSAYRSKSEVEDWKRRDNPLTRLRKWLEAKSWWSAGLETQAQKDIRASVLKAFAAAEKQLLPPPQETFADVYAAPEISPALAEQRAEVMGLVEKYPDYYKIHEFQRSDNSQA